MAKFRLDRALHVTKDWGEAVETDDPRGAFVLGGEGSEIEYELAESLGLVGGEKMRTPKENKVIRPQGNKEVDATAAAIALAKEHGVSLTTIQGSGLNGRILKSDVEAAINGATDGS